MLPVLSLLSLPPVSLPPAATVERPWTLSLPPDAPPCAASRSAAWTTRPRSTPSSTRESSATSGSPSTASPTSSPPASSLAAQPYVTPTGSARSGAQIFFHGPAASRMIHALGDGIDVCVTVTLVDGFVLSRSAFHHSINYRSVVMLGRARIVADPAEKTIALACITNHILPGRWDEVRPPSDQELTATMLLPLPPPPG